MTTTRTAPTASPSPQPNPPEDPGPVVVAVGPDGSPAALRYAAAVAGRTAVHVLHVVELRPGAAAGDREAVTEAVRRAEAVVRDAEASARLLAGADARLTSELAHGDVVGRIVAAGAGARLLVVQQPPRSAPGTSRPEVCARVAAHVLAPVVCVPWSWTGAHHGRTVTVGVADPLTCGPLVAEGLAAASSSGARLRLLHVGAGADAERQHALVRAALEEVGVAGTGVEATFEIVQGPVGSTLREAAQTSGLLVLGRHHPHHVGGSALGPVARSVVRRSSCPVLLATPAHSTSSGEWVFRTHLA